MDYEVLIIGTESPTSTAKLGEIVAAFPRGHAWSAKERAKPFTIIPLAGEAKDITELLNGGYRYDSGKFIHIETGEEFDSSIAFDASQAPVCTDSAKWAAAIDPCWQSKNPSPCKFLHARHLERRGYDVHEITGYVRTRAYWFNRFRKFKNLEGMKAMLAASVLGDYAVIGKIANSWPQATWDALITSGVFTEEDKKYMRWIGNHADGSNL